MAQTTKEFLSQKITDERSLLACPQLPSPNNRWYAAAGVTHPSTGVRTENLPWWLQREHARIVAGVYETSAVLDVINQSWAAQYAVHISKTDRAMVAYTPSPEAGLADKQVHTTFGRFLRKHFITLTDDQIQQLEQDHRSELFAVFQVAKSKEEIERVYRNMVGDSACMRHHPGYYGITNDAHPSHVYSAPGMGVAYTEDAKGQVKSRAVVYENPADPQDKRYVRLYGDPVLGKLLKAAGYVPRSLNGAQIRRIPRVNNSDGVTPLVNVYVVPYLDGVEGNQNLTSGTFVVDEGDADYLRLVDSERYGEITTSLGTGFVVQAKSTAAYITLRPLPDTTYVSDLTGIKYNLFTGNKTTVWLAHAKRLGYADAEEVPTLCTAGCTVDGEGRSVRCFIPHGVPVFMYRYTACVDNDYNRETLGFRRLATKYYQNADWYQGQTLKTKAGYIKHSDGLMVLPAEGEYYFTHISELPALRKHGFVNTNSGNVDFPRVINKARPTARRTIGGTWFDTEYNDGQFVELMEGGWMAKKSAESAAIFGVTLYSAKGLEATDEKVIIESFKRSSPGGGIDTMLTGIDVDTDAQLARTLMARIEKKVLAGLYYESHALWNVRSESGVRIGDPKYGAYTIAQAVEFVAQAKVAVEMRSWFETDIKRFIAVTDVLTAYVAPRMAELKTLIAQKELEAAGQMRLDTPETLTVEVINDETYALAA